MKDIVFYDGNCEFCKEVKRIMMKLDKKGQLKWQPLQTYKGSYFSASELHEQLHAISENGRIYRGFYAVRKILMRLPYWKWLAVALYLPGIPFFGRKIYRLIARKRGRIMYYIRKYLPHKNVKCLKREA
ncbi:thiol-disulfide oxidoreductase DCC family protein [Listeria sp. ILCC797]|uniref:thiol-disulfide oxidoreductase DCC family protein n=1 Tax=Listeria sp. ILCC797 TaxID=1918333 RepID=UPI000B595575|nr:DUF393 domain-containing protein [Listeria sp. ILCC797]